MINYIDKIIAYESGEMDEDEMIEFFQELVSTGDINHLQGSYSRQAQSLIDAGLISFQVSEYQKYRG